jgi:hypothetical protein
MACHRSATYNAPINLHPPPRKPVIAPLMKKRQPSGRSNSSSLMHSNVFCSTRGSKSIKNSRWLQRLHDIHSQTIMQQQRGTTLVHRHNARLPGRGQSAVGGTGAGLSDHMATCVTAKSWCGRAAGIDGPTGVMATYKIADCTRYIPYPLCKAACSRHAS